MVTRPRPEGTRRLRERGSCTVLALAVVLVLGQCSGDGGSDRPSERSRIVDTVTTARAGLLGGDAQAACSLLTARGRALAVRLSAYLQGEGGLARPQLRTCEEAVGDQRAEANRAATSWPRDLRRARFTVEEVSRRRATVRLTVGKPPAARFRLLLRETPSGWRIDGAPQFAELERSRPPASGRAPTPPPPPPPPPPEP